MLIVIVIIGILAAAIIPRLNSARGRANDVARKADLNQVATALITYQLDEGWFPTTGTTLDQISSVLIDWWMTSIPRDPANPNLFSGVEFSAGIAPTPWQYAYTPIVKNWIDWWWFVLMAKMESPWQANYVICSWSTNEIITQSKEYNEIHICQKIDPWTSCQAASTWDQECKYSDLSQLRYIYKY